MATQIKLRRDSYQNWYNANPTLALGEPAYDTTNNKLKIGNGTSAWRSLGYLADSTATSQLVNGDLTVSLNNKGTLTVPHLLPKTFTATVDDAHYAGTLTLTDDAWHFDVTFSANNNGTVTTYIDNQTPWASNPGYTNNMEFTFTEADHGIPDFTFTLTLVDIQNPGPMTYTTNLTASQPPAYPTTISNGETIKFVADAANYIMGADGTFRSGYFSGTTQQTFLANSDGVGIRIDSFNTPTTVDIGDNGYDNLRIIYGVQSVNGNPGDVELQSTPIGGGESVPSSIIISPQGGQSGSFIFGSTGTITKADRLTVNSGGVESGFTAAVIADGDLGKVLLRTDNGTTTRTWEFDKDGNLKLPSGGDIKDAAGNSVLGGGGTSDRITANGISIYVNGNGTLVLPATDTEILNTAIISSTAKIQLNSNGDFWTFGNGILSLPFSNYLETIDTNLQIGSQGAVTIRSNAEINLTTKEWQFSAGGDLQLPATGSNGYNYQFDAAQNTNVLAGAAPTVVFNSVQSSSLESVKAIVKVSAQQAPAGGFEVIDSQICEMLITSRVSVPVGGGTLVRSAVATIYGVTHTSTNPLATFSVNFFNNPNGPDTIQILAEPTAAVTGTSMDVQVVAIELMNYA